MLEGNEDLIGKISPSGNIVGAMIAQKGEKGNTGQAFTYDMFTEEQLKALTGPKGDPGIQGPKGDNGITPTIGDNGNWYLGSDDTGKPSRGIQGEQGAPGKDAPNMYKYKEILTADVAKGGTITLPCYYKVGTHCLDVYYMGELLILSSDDAGSDGHYREVGEANAVSNKIKLTTDWGAEANEYFEFIVRR